MKVACKGSVALGTACGNCDKCQEEKTMMNEKSFVNQALLKQGWAPPEKSTALEKENKALRKLLEMQVRCLKATHALIVNRNPVGSSIVQDLAPPLRVQAIKLSKQINEIGEHNE